MREIFFCIAFRHIQSIPLLEQNNVRFHSTYLRKCVRKRGRADKSTRPLAFSDCLTERTTRSVVHSSDILPPDRDRIDNLVDLVGGREGAELPSVRRGEPEPISSRERSIEKHDLPILIADLQTIGDRLETNRPAFRIDLPR